MQGSSSEVGRTLCKVTWLKPSICREMVSGPSFGKFLMFEYIRENALCSVKS